MTQKVFSPKPEWDHPHNNKVGALSEKELYELSLFYFLKTLMYFKKTQEGSIRTGVDFKLSYRLKKKLGYADLRNGIITLNGKYFQKSPELLPYTLFHELTHIWLYDCFLDPNHTRRFYNKMEDFVQTSLPIDKAVHIHKRVAPEGRYIYECSGCFFRWHYVRPLKRPYTCESCWKLHKRESYLLAFKKPALEKPASSTITNFKNTEIHL